MTQGGDGERLGRTVVALRWPIIGTFAVLIALAAAALPHLKLELGIDRVLEPNDAELEQVRTLDKDLPPKVVDAVVALGFEKEIGRPELQRLATIVQRLDDHPRIRVVTSLPTIRVVDGKGLLARPKPFPQTLGDRTVLEAGRAHPLLMRTLLSEDGRATVVQVAGELDEDFDADDLLGTLDEVLPGLTGSEITTRLLGGAVVDRALRARMKKDVSWTLGLELILFSIVLPLLFRTARGSLLPMLVVVGSVVLNFGWMSWLGYSIAIIDIVIPGLVVIIGLCDAIHMVHRFEEEYRIRGDKTAAIGTMLARVGHACFHTSFTTGVGFLSLLLTDHATVSGFGVKAAVSVGVTFATVVLAVPAALAIWPVGKPVAERRVRVDWLRPAPPRRVIFVTVAVVLVASLGIAQVTIDSFLLEELPEDDPVTQDVRWFEQHFTGILQLEARASGSLTDAGVFADVERFEAAMLEEPGVTRIASFTSWVRESLGNPSGSLSSAQIKAGLAKLRLAPEVFPTDLIAPDADQCRIVMLTRDVGTRRILQLRERMLHHARGLTSEVLLEPTGYTLMATDSASLIVEAITKSLGASLIVITVFISIIFRSIKIGLISLIPNMLPLVIALGVSGWAGLNLRIGSALIYCLGLGLAVDDAIHLITRYLQERRARPDASTDDHLTVALRSSGKALITTSIVLGIGTLCHLVASFQSIRHVGVLLFTVVITALAADLWLLPHLLRRARLKEGPRS